jgi:cellulose synthase/poly-beta-1,6-N-acetylglucosamine synthase-like glycosyltransferase
VCSSDLLHGDRFAYFAVADADEILPSEFLSICVSRLSQRPGVGFAQCAHAARESGASEFAARHGLAIAGHWRHFVPAREWYGLLPFYGHGAVIRMDAWREVGGFPEIVSEDMALTIQLRRAGFHGIYVPDVVCEENFPPDFRAIARRTGKWVRGTLEFLRSYGMPMCRSPRISLVEKLDVLFCAMGLLLPMPLLLVLLLMASLYLANGHDNLKVALAALWDDPVVFTTGALAMIAPTTYMLAELPRHRLRVIRQLVFSTCTYLGLVPHSAWESLGYLVTGRATFPVTGSSRRAPRRGDVPKHVCLLLLSGFVFFASVAVADLLLMGVALAFVLGLVQVRRHPALRLAWCLPFALVLLGVMLKPLSLLAMPLAIGTSFAAHE